MQLKEDNTSPLSSQEFDELMAGLSCEWPNNIAVAVSGGGDSMALVLLLASWCEKNQITLHGLTVDHGLRVASHDEALQVGDWLSDLNASHHVLKWHGDKPTANIQSEARKARYQLMGDWCVTQGVRHLFLAHHMDDQAETFLMRLLRGSGVDGLVAMERVAALPILGLDIQIARPLLNVPKERLLQTLKGFGQEWISDPSNKNEDFTRVKVRNLLAQSDIDGLNSEKLSNTAQKMGRVRSLLNDLTSQAAADFVTFDALGYAVLDGNFLEKLHEEIALRLLAAILKRVSGGFYVPRYEKLLSFYKTLKVG
ncbi:MAG: tRNA lysidine(34) synthetase TilS, partial [Emcibacteraceae bacterium]|nr:tRNA lysidine(34) synthetase TilS [Emcibacteraceae bacterium]